MDPEQIVREVEERMAEGGWLGSKPQDRAVPAVPPMPKRERPTLITTQLPKQQAHLLLAFPCAPLGHPDRNKLEILSGTLSGQGGRLFVELRDRQSLAYSVSSYVALGLDAGYFALNIATSPEKIEQAARGLMGQLARLRDEAIPQAEFERVRTWFLGNHDIHYQSFGSRAATMALDELYGLGYDAWRRYPDELASIQPDGLQALAQRTFDPSKACLVVVRPQGAAMPDLSDLGLGDPQEVAAESVLRYPT
jgi:zinc protease